MNRVKKDDKWYTIHITNFQTFECELIEDPDYVEPKEVVVKHVFDTSFGFDKDECKTIDLGDLE